MDVSCIKVLKVYVLIIYIIYVDFSTLIMLLYIGICIRNKAHPEGSIAEGYLADECLIFCSRYLNQIETKFNREERNYDGGEHLADPSRLSIFSSPGKALGKGVFRNLSSKLHKAAHHFVLTNCVEAQPFVE